MSDRFSHYLTWRYDLPSQVFPRHLLQAGQADQPHTDVGPQGQAGHAGPGGEGDQAAVLQVGIGDGLPQSGQLQLTKYGLASSCNRN